MVCGQHDDDGDSERRGKQRTRRRVGPKEPRRRRSRTRAPQLHPLLRQVLAGDLTTLVAAHLPLPDVLALARTSSEVRGAVRSAVLPRVQSALVCTTPALPSNKGAHGQHVRPLLSRAVRLPHTDLHTFLRTVPLQGLERLQVDCCVPTFFQGYVAVDAAGVVPPRLNTLTLLLSRKHARGSADDVVGVGAFPGLCEFLGRVATSLVRLSVHALDFVLGPTFLSGLPPLPRLQGLELGEVAGLPSAHDLTRVLRGLPALKCLELHRYELPRAVDDHTFGASLVQALHASLCDLEELSVVGAWLDVRRLVANVSTLVNVTWYSSECDFAGEGGAGNEGEEGKAPPYPSALLSLRLLAASSAGLHSDRDLHFLARTCPLLTHLHVEDLPLLLPESRLQFPEHPQRFWCGLAVLDALHVFPRLAELEIGLEWPHPISATSQHDLVNEISLSLASLLSRASSLRSVTVLLQRFPALPEHALDAAVKGLEECLARDCAGKVARSVQLTCLAS